jgi:hypothetical protein
VDDRLVFFMKLELGRKAGTSCQLASALRVTNPGFSIAYPCHSLSSARVTDGVPHNYQEKGVGKRYDVIINSLSP